MAEVIHMYESTNLDQRVEEVLEGVLAKNPRHLFIIAWPEEGMPTYHSTTSDMPIVTMRLREFEHKLFNGDLSGDRT
mgnify:CR=1 FL=1